MSVLTDAGRIKDLEDKLQHARMEADVAKGLLAAAGGKPPAAPAPPNFRLVTPREFKHPNFAGVNNTYAPFKEYLLEFFSSASINDEKERFDTLKAHVDQTVWASYLNKPTTYDDFINRLERAFAQPITRWTLVNSLHRTTFSGDYTSFALEILRKLATLEKFLADRKLMAYLKYGAEGDESEWTTLARLMAALLPEGDPVRTGLNNHIRERRVWHNEEDIICDVRILAEANAKAHPRSVALAIETEEEDEYEDEEEYDAAAASAQGAPQQQVLAFDGAQRGNNQDEAVAEAATEAAAAANNRPQQRRHRHLPSRNQRGREKDRGRGDSTSGLPAGPDERECFRRFE